MMRQQPVQVVVFLALGACASASLPLSQTMGPEPTLVSPRWILVLPNGDVLVAETNAPPRPDDGKILEGWVTGLLMKSSGAAVPSANRITLPRDRDGDGVADLRAPFLEGINSPFGMTLVDGALYVAASDAVLRFPC